MGLRLKLENALTGSGPPVKDKELLQQKPPSLVSLVEQVLDSKKESHHFFRPSMLFGCDRQNVFHYTHAPSHPQRQDNRMIRILDNGTAVHRVIQEYLGLHPDCWFVPEAKLVVDVEGALIRGSTDGIMIRRSDMYRWGVEIKTIGHDDFMRLTKPKDAHVFQASIYAVLSRVWWITILYWDKDKQHLKEFPVEFSPERWKDTKARVKELKALVDSGEIPEFDPDSCDTTFCGFYEHCKKLGGPR